MVNEYKKALDFYLKNEINTELFENILFKGER